MCNQQYTSFMSNNGKQTTSHYLNQGYNSTIYWCTHASLGLNELTHWGTVSCVCLQWNFDRSLNIFFHENTCVNVYETVSLCLDPRRVSMLKHIHKLRLIPGQKSPKLKKIFRKPKNYIFHIHEIIFNYTHDLIIIIQENRRILAVVDGPSWNVAFYFSKLTPHAHPHPNGFIEHLVQKHLFSVILRGRWQQVKEKNGSILGIWLYFQTATFSKRHAPITFTSQVDVLGPAN